MQLLEGVVSLGFVHRRLDDAQRNRVYSNAVLYVLHRQRPRHRVQTALGHDLNGHGYAGDRVVHERRRDIHNAAALLSHHLPDRQLRNVEKARGRRREQGVEILARVPGEGLKDKNARIVYQHIAAAVSTTRAAVSGSPMSPATNRRFADASKGIEWPMFREFATTS